MQQNVEKYSEKIFESIMHINEFGQEFWYARELQVVLEYKQWRRFNLQLARILPSSTGGEMNCKNRKNNTEHLFWL